MRTVYFDYNATTPLDERVREAMMPFLGHVWGNPSSIHHVGRQARAHLDDFRDRAARVLGCRPSEVIFTSGGTESVNLAILGTARRLKPRGRHIVTSSIEHHAVLHCCEDLARNEGFEVTYLPVDQEGLVLLEALESALRPDTILVSIMAANNEIGSIQPIARIGALCHERGIRFHTDAVQWFGKERFDGVESLNADLISICAHKIHGPKGAGALYAASPIFPKPLLLGGAHENEHRAGTENLAGIAGLVTAMELFVPEPVFCREKLAPLTDRLIALVDRLEGVQFAGSRDFRLANTVSFVTKGSDSIALLAGLDLEGICASSGSACSAGSLEASHVIQALGLGNEAANSLIRFSLGRESTPEEVALVEGALPSVIERSQPLNKRPATCE
jgi:cysteine desulfurase